MTEEYVTPVVELLPIDDVLTASSPWRGDDDETPPVGPDW